MLSKRMLFAECDPVFERSGTFANAADDSCALCQAVEWYLSDWA